MAKQVNKTVIGAFVISVIVMLIGGVIIIGGGNIFKNKVKFVMFFEQSIKGLSKGAPVVFKGVEIGSVSSIVIDYNTDNLKVNIPVVIEIDPSRMQIKGLKNQNIRSLLNRMVERGFRAQLGLQSLVTGQLMIELDFFPDTPVRLTGIMSEYPEIPTIPSSMELLTQKLKELPIQQIADKITEILDNIEKMTSNPKIDKIVKSLDAASNNLNAMILDLDGRTKKVLENFMVASSDAQKMMGDARKLVKGADGKIQPLLDKAQDALVSAKSAMDHAKTTLAGVNNFVGENSDTRYKLNRALDAFAVAAQSINSLMDYLERHPEALLKGKSVNGG
jgi:paraquat-inducible protein B